MKSTATLMMRFAIPTIPPIPGGGVKIFCRLCLMDPPTQFSCCKWLGPRYCSPLALPGIHWNHHLFILICRFIHMYRTKDTSNNSASTGRLAARLATDWGGAMTRTRGSSLMSTEHFCKDTYLSYWLTLSSSILVNLVCSWSLCTVCTGCRKNVQTCCVREQKNCTYYK